MAAQDAVPLAGAHRAASPARIFAGPSLAGYRSQSGPGTGGSGKALLATIRGFGTGEVSDRQAAPENRCRLTALFRVLMPGSPDKAHACDRWVVWEGGSDPAPAFPHRWPRVRIKEKIAQLLCNRLCPKQMCGYCDGAGPRVPWMPRGPRLADLNNSHWCFERQDGTSKRPPAAMAQGLVRRNGRRVSAQT